MTIAAILIDLQGPGRRDPWSAAILIDLQGAWCGVSPTSHIAPAGRIDRREAARAGRIMSDLDP